MRRDGIKGRARAIGEYSEYQGGTGEVDKAERAAKRLDAYIRQVEAGEDDQVPQGCRGAVMSIWNTGGDIPGYRWIDNCSESTAAWCCVYPSDYVIGPSRIPAGADERLTETITRMVGRYKPTKPAAVRERW